MLPSIQEGLFLSLDERRQWWGAFVLGGLVFCSVELKKELKGALSLSYILSPR